MRRNSMLVAAMAAMLAGSAGAQDVVQWSAPAAPANGQYAYFPMGTPLRLATRTELSSKEARAGDRLYLEVAEPLVYRGRTVLPAGSLAVGEVTRAERNGYFGKRGEMAMHLLYVQTPSGPIRLSGRAERAGKSQAVLSIGGAALVSWTMMFIHGTSARLPAETPVTAYLADDLRFPIVAEDPRVADAGSAVRALPASFDPAAFGPARR